MSTRSRCAGGTPERGDVLRRRTDGGNSGGSYDSDDSGDEAVAAAALVLAADRAWHEANDIPHVEMSETFSISADDSPCEFRRTDSHAAKCGACGKKFGVHSYFRSFSASLPSPYAVVCPPHPPHPPNIQSSRARVSYFLVSRAASNAREPLH